MNEGAYLGPYIASKALKIPQGPGQPLLKIPMYGVFSFDGDEPIDIKKLLQAQSIMPYMGDIESLED